ncbi:MAG: transcription-repair coupling factor [Bacteroidota bacterium]|nr:transcription-repair coupling factor [Bacteroidota bacterium]
MTHLELLQVYLDDKRLQNLIQYLKSDAQETFHALIQGLRGSLESIIGASVYTALNYPQCYILPDRESAEYFQNDLQSFLDAKKIWLYPSPYKNDSELYEPDNQSILDRTEVLNALKNPNNRQIVVTYPEAVLELVADAKSIQDNTFEIEVNSNLDIDFIIEFLMSYQFERTDFVYEAGTFSIRGGIIDVFSYASDLPIRIELLEDKIESIRMFDPDSQLSVKKLSKVTIIPNVETQEEESIKRISFFDCLAKKTIIFSPNLFLLFDKIKFLNEKLEKYKHRHENEYQYVHHQQSSSDIQRQISKRTTIEFGNKSFFKPNLELVFDIRPQPEFNKNFKLLAEDLQKNKDKGFENLIFSDQSRQIERLYAILEDMGHSDLFIPVYKILHSGFADVEKDIACYTEHQIFGRYQRYKGKRKYTKSEAITLKELYDLKPGDYVTHLDHGIGIFSGLQKLEFSGKVQEAVRLKYAGGDLLYVNIHSLHKISRFSGQDGKAPKINKLGTNTWENLKSKTKTKVKEMARDLIMLYAKRKSTPGFAFSKDSYMQTELEASFMYEDTPDQAKSTEDLKRDMEAPHPMDRLICGDVGFGKTEVAIRAAFKAVSDSKQVAVLVPTTVLASQHNKTFKSRLAEFPVTVDFISRFKNAAQQKETLKRVEDGKVDILIGTHRILSKDIKWKNIGLLIIDEEQKFGVAAKEKLRMLKSNIDTLTLTATPIPRTLSFSLMGARDMSIIQTPPPNRQPVRTQIHTFDKELITEAIENELGREGQVFFVHNRVKDIHEMADSIRAMVPGARVSVGHAQMEPEKLEEIMLNFIEGYYDILVCTNIIEAGLDIPNVNTIIINMAQNHGLSDLYQLRGRVGRSNKKAYCYLLTPPKSVLTPEARKRLSALEEHTELGSGFHIAMKDLDIRGAGNLLGGEQSGFIAEIGLEMYQKIINEAMHELKEEEFKDLFKDKKPIFKIDAQVETDFELHIPDYYITNIHERLTLYNKLNALKDEVALQKFRKELRDRFGKIPKPTRELLDIVRLKWILQSIHIDKAVLKRGKMKASFNKLTRPEFFQKDEFGKILNYLQSHPQMLKLHQENNEMSFSISNIHSAHDAVVMLKEILEIETEAIIK